MNKQIFIENVIRFVVMVGDGGWGGLYECGQKVQTSSYK